VTHSEMSWARMGWAVKRAAARNVTASLNMVSSSIGMYFLVKTVWFFAFASERKVGSKTHKGPADGGYWYL
jgi:hypothetical protein